MSFDALLDKVLGVPLEGYPLEQVGPACERLHEMVGGDPERSRPMIATIAWQAFAHSPQFDALLGSLPGGAREFLRATPIIVARPQIRRFDLVVLHTQAAPTEMAFQAKADGADLVEGWMNFVDTLDNPPLFGTLAPMVAVEAFRSNHPFDVVIAPAPPTRLVSVPPGVWTVRTRAGIESTAGVTAIDKKKRSGVTAALHAVLSAKHVTVDGHTGTVVRRDKISDSCFIECSPGYPGTLGDKGPLVNLLPRGNETVQFDGRATGSNTTYVKAWDLAAPNITKTATVRIYTPPVTDQGDSGSALIEVNGNHVLGFAHDVTGRGVVPAYSSWVWAHLVYDSLDLEY